MPLNQRQRRVVVGNLRSASERHRRLHVLPPPLDVEDATGLVIHHQVDISSDLKQRMDNTAQGMRQVSVALRWGMIAIGIAVAVAVAAALVYAAAQAQQAANRRGKRR